MRSPGQLWRAYRARRRSMRVMLQLFAASGVIRSADQGIRYTLSDGRVDAVFPMQPGEWYRWIRWR